MVVTINDDLARWEKGKERLLVESSDQARIPRDLLDALSWKELLQKKKRSFLLCNFEGYVNTVISIFRHCVLGKSR